MRLISATALMSAAALMSATALMSAAALISASARIRPWLPKHLCQSFNVAENAARGSVKNKRAALLGLRIDQFSEVAFVA